MSDPTTRTFAILWRPGPTWVPGLPLQAQDLAGHRDYIARLVHEGHLVFAGALLDEASGGLAVLRARDEEAARQLVGDDPAVRDGVFVADVRPFRIIFGRIAHHSADPSARDDATIRGT